MSSQALAEKYILMPLLRELFLSLRARRFSRCREMTVILAGTLEQ
jgi:hypothetical protein